MKRSDRARISAPPRGRRLALRLAVGLSAAASALAPWACSRPKAAPPAVVLSPKELLGKRIFFDSSLSDPAGQSCASCHAPEAGFSDPLHRAVSTGAGAGRAGNRNAPSAAYLAFAPPRRYDEAKKKWLGGLFWDGRAGTLAEQAAGPFVNPLEMANADAAAVAARLRRAAYWPDLVALYPEAAGDRDPGRVFQAACDALASYERSAELNPFDSKYDAWVAGKVQLSDSETRGFSLFNDAAKGNCAACHTVVPAPGAGKSLFTDFSYDNLGVPRNPGNPFYRQEARFNAAGEGWTDRGLGVETKAARDEGKFRAPTLRNVARTAPYMHNGSLRTLEDVVRFYNVRDVRPATFSPPEVPANINREQMGNLRLSPSEEADLVAFLRTLTDGWKP